MVTNITAPSFASAMNRNTGIVPPWIQYPITILPMPDGWSDDAEEKERRAVPTAA